MPTQAMIAQVMAVMARMIKTMPPRMRSNLNRFFASCQTPAMRSSKGL